MTANRFYLIDFIVKYIFPFPIFRFFTYFSAKSQSVTQRSVTQEKHEKCIQKGKHQSIFLRKTIGSNNSFTLLENNFSILRLVWIQCNNTLYMVYRQNVSNCHPLILFPIRIYIQAYRKIHSQIHDFEVEHVMGNLCQIFRLNK